ncbi:hypothetical protein CAXC1_150052 [Candidatus Xenohaliotis californiensis]|uniref:Molybdate ABC transporter substrate-binding protein n=1 Tax=Candidatus Xenohaliotis californiensis TaxID=84677 RepID=A0ABP0EWD4_9RICK|nr:hypothetical protein CAXC1_150052 [Candidatus Xenohaliotis californiensis]
MLTCLRIIILILLFSGYRCLSFDYKIDIFLDSEAIYSVSELLSEYSQSNNVRMYINIGNSDIDNVELLNKKDVFFVTSKELAAILLNKMDLDGYKTIPMGKLVLVGYAQNKLIQSNLFDLDLQYKLLEIAKYGYLSIGVSSNSYGNACVELLNELGVYQQISDSLERYASGEMVLNSIMQKNGFGLLPMKLSNDKDLVIIDSISGIKNASLYLYAIYSSKALALVDFVANGF